ncbi:MAG: DDE-type integrase/transposase/recombinase [Gammaproteobacteria bacterium]|nr:DDE-type integrase/transposase/recombinase [Gammaproteobacteria bacterium]
MSEFNYTIVHRPGKNNQPADFLSRPTSANNSCGTIHSITTSQSTSDTFFTSSSSDFRQLQMSDPTIRQYTAYPETGELPNDTALARKIALSADNFTMSDALLHHIDYNQHKVLQFYVPASLIAEMLEAFHMDKFAGHFAVQKTLQKLRTNYYWPTMVQDVRRFCQGCHPCQQRKRPNKHTRAPLVSLPVEGPWDRVSMDIIGPLLPSEPHGYKYILVFNEYLTKWVEAFPLRSITSETVAKVFVESIICRFSTPRQLLSDRAPNFLSSLMHDIYKLCNIRKLNTTPYHPQCDGLTENFNATLTKTLASYATKHIDWPDYLPFALFAYRTSVHSSTGESPYYLLFGNDPRLPIDSVLTPPFRHSPSVHDYPTKMARMMKQTWSEANERIQAAQQQQKLHYDKKVTPTDFKLGQRVWLQNERTRPGEIPKFRPKFIGNYRIIDLKLPNALLKSLDKPDGTPFWSHINKLRPIVDIPAHLQTPCGGERETQETPNTPTQQHPNSPPSQQTPMHTPQTRNHPTGANPKFTQTRYNLRPRHQ